MGFWDRFREKAKPGRWVWIASTTAAYSWRTRRGENFSGLPSAPRLPAESLRAWPTALRTTPTDVCRASGVLANCNTNGAEHGYELAADARCWSDALHKNGYSLGYIGKWHLDSPFRPYVDTSNNSDDFAWNEWTSPDRRHGFDFWNAWASKRRRSSYSLRIMGTAWAPTST